MRKILFLLFICVSIEMVAQQKEKYYLYCYIEYNSDKSALLTTSDWTRRLADKDGNEIEFPNVVCVINELTKNGYEYVEFINPVSLQMEKHLHKVINNRAVDYILMRKLVSSKRDLRSGLHFVPTASQMEEDKKEDEQEKLTR